MDHIMKRTAALMIFIVSATLLCACAAKKGADITVKTEMEVDRSAESDSGAGTIKEVEITSGNEAAKQEGEEMQSGFEDYPNIEVSGIETDSLTEKQMEILLLQARYCQAMTDADTDTMRELVSENMTYTHMSGKTHHCYSAFSQHSASIQPAFSLATAKLRIYQKI